MKRLSILFVFALIASLATVGFAAEKTFKADLSPKAEIAAPASSNASGVATFEVVKPGAGGAGAGGVVGSGEGAVKGQGSSVPESYQGFVDNARELSHSRSGAAAGGTAGEALRYQLRVKNINDVTAAHLHLGKPGTAEGPVIAPLYLGEKTGQYNGRLAEGVITSSDLSGPMSGKTIADLVNEMKAGNVYVNVHTVQNPAGEIRGEVQPAG